MTSHLPMSSATGSRPREIASSSTPAAARAGRTSTYEPLDSLVWKPATGSTNIGLFAARPVVFALALSSPRRATRSIDPSAGWVGAILLGLSFGLFATMLFWLAVFARHRRIAYRGDWARAIRRGGWVGPRDRPVRRPPAQQGASPGRSALFILALVAVAEATLSVER